MEEASKTRKVSSFFGRMNKKKPRWWGRMAQLGDRTRLSPHLTLWSYCFFKEKQNWSFANIYCVVFNREENPHLLIYLLSLQFFPQGKILYYLLCWEKLDYASFSFFYLFVYFVLGKPSQWPKLCWRNLAGEFKPLFLCLWIMK